MKNRKLKNLKNYELTPAETAQCDAIHAILNGIAESTNKPVKDVIALSSTKTLLNKWNVKICRTCNDILPETLFSNRKNSSGEIVKRNTCKKCVQNYYQHQYKPNKASSESDDVKLVISGGEITGAKPNILNIDFTPDLKLDNRFKKVDGAIALAKGLNLIESKTDELSNSAMQAFVDLPAKFGIKPEPDELFTPQNEIMFELESAIQTALLLNEKLSALELKIEKLFESGGK